MTYSTFKTAHVLVGIGFFYKYVVSSCQYHRAKKIVFRITINNNLDVIASKLGSISYAKSQIHGTVYFSDYFVITTNG